LFINENKDIIHSRTVSADRLLQKGKKAYKQSKFKTAFTFLKEYINAIAAYNKSLELDPDSRFAAKCKRKIRELTAHKKKMDKFYGRN